MVVAVAWDRLEDGGRLGVDLVGNASLGNAGALFVVAVGTVGDSDGIWGSSLSMRWSRTKTVGTRSPVAG